MIRVALIGAGIIAHSYLKAISQIDRLRAVAIADVNEEKAHEVAHQYGLQPYFDYKVMLEKERVDLAIVALPHFLHKDVCIYCANMKCHILVEKPMALTVDECEQMILEANRNHVQLMVGLTQHYFTENLKAKELVQQGHFGELVMINDTRHQNYFLPTRPDWFFEKQKAGGGILTNLGAHSIDKIQWMLDTSIRKVKGSLSYYGNRGDIEGSGSVFMETQIGVPATVVQSGYNGVNHNETHLIFTKGMIRLQTGKGLWVSENGEYKEVPLPDRQDPFVLKLLDLADAIDGVRPLKCSGEYAKSINAVLEAIYQSYELGKAIEVSKVS